MTSVFPSRSVSHDESQLMSGGSDSELVRWRDVTQTHRDEKDKASQLLVQQEQELANLIHGEQMLAALKLALTLERPLQVLRIVKRESGHLLRVKCTRNAWVTCSN